MSHKLCLMVCKKLKKEMQAVLSDYEGRDVELRTFPARCDTGIEWDTVRRILKTGENDFDRVDVIGGGCFARLAAPPPDLINCHLHKYNLCFQLFSSAITLNHFIEQGAYLLLPGWLARWKDQMKSWGFDHDSAAEFFGDFSTKLLLLDTGTDPNSSTDLQEFADFVELPAETIPVGMETLQFLVTTIITEWQAHLECQQKVDALLQANRQTTDYAMAFDWVSNLPQLGTEEAVIERILEFFVGLFAPGRLVYTSVVNDQPVNSWVYPSVPAVGGAAKNDVDNATFKNNITLIATDYEWTANEQGFLLKIEHHEKTVGMITVEDLFLPQYKQQYLNLALTLSKVCGLVIGNTRVLRGILPICANCKKIRDTHNQWQPVDVYIHKHSEINFSHGLCPECAAKLYPDFYQL